METVKAAIIGYGGIARAHKEGYDRLKMQNDPVKLVAVCDIVQEKCLENGKKKEDLEEINVYNSVTELLQNEEFDMADICLPSYLHAEYAIKFMRSGKNVLSEKPMALNSLDAEKMLMVAKETGKRLMIGQCLRFDPAYIFLKQIIDTDKYGKLRSLTMERLNNRPKGGYMDWYLSTEKSGGALFDLHIHDIDMIRHLLGEPNAVSSLAMDDTVKYQYVDSRLKYDDIIVSAIASFDQVGSFPFTMTYRSNFENASVVFDGENVKIYPEDGSAIIADIGDGERMADEIRYFGKLILNKNMENTVNPPESAVGTILLLEKLKESADHNGNIVIV